MAHAL
jgi:hypothetical protein